jgi:multicomponent Na+:H+ antiporter subunit A
MATNRMAAAALLGATGLLVAVAFALLGAPDLVLTQLLVDTLTVVLVVLVFRRLPQSFHPTSPRRRRAGLALGSALGLGAAAVTWLVAGRRELSEVGAYYLDAGPRDAAGNNVVNTILVDFRALDTLGEITVLAMAAIGVFALVGPRRKPK